MILVKDIIKDNHPTLRKVAQKVEEPFSKEDLKTLREMMKYLKNSQNEEKCKKYDLRPGVGLAAPQINVSKRMLAIFVDNGDEEFEYAIINPEILAESTQMVYLPGGEGCLSLPGKNGEVPRHKKIKVKATFYDIKNKTLEERTVMFTGYLAIVFQHEFDHLNGVLFIDKVKQNMNGVDPLNI